MKRRLTWLWVILGLVILIVGGFIIWASLPLGPMPEAAAALQSDDRVSVEQGAFITFRPNQENPAAGFIFYPGGRVDDRSYAPLARSIAEQGYEVVIVPMPLNLAVFGSDKASSVIAQNPDIQDWAIGGHSLGGAMAAAYVYQNPGKVDGLVLYAAYPASNNSLSGQNLPVLSISGERDGLATQDKIQASRSLLPENTKWLSIQGGNHAQFGWYGPQSGDNPPGISREEQQAEIVSATVEFLKNLEGQ